MRSRRAVVAAVTSLVLAATGAACKDAPTRTEPPPPAAPVAPVPAALGDPVHGKALVEALQCNRCHDGTEAAPPPANKHCVHCHADIVSGAFAGTPAQLARWKPIVSELTSAPSLAGSSKRLTRTFVRAYLARPHDLRPALVQSMPRLALTQQQIDDLAAYLAPDDPPRVAPEGDLEAGRRVLESKGCTTCHAMTGVPGLAISPIPVVIGGAALARAKRLAPDLRFVRERQSPSATAAWLADPEEVTPGTAMPRIPLSDVERRDVVAFLHRRELDELPRPAPKARLPLLARKVTYAEVDKAVFHRTCWHCHSEPDYAIGDGGPGNSGGFGFEPRGLVLSDYAGIAAGFLNAKKERESIFAAGPDGVPRVVTALLARHAEEAFAETGPVRGMPLGYPPLALEDIQLVDSWIAQGRPR